MSFGSEPTGMTRTRLDNFMVLLMNNSKSKGYIISYKSINGTLESYARPSRKMTLIKNHIRFRKFDEKRIVYIDGGFQLKEGYKLFMVSDKLQPPSFLGFESIPNASKLEEIGEANSGKIKAIMDIVAIAQYESKGGKIYIINYGKDIDVRRRKRLMQNQIYFRRYDASKYKFIRARKYGKLKTEFWLLPSDAEVKLPPYNVSNFRSLRWSVWTQNFDLALNVQKKNSCKEKIYVVIYGKSNKTIKSIIKTYADYVAKKSKCQELENNGIEFIKGGVSRNYSTAIWMMQAKD